MAPCKMIWSISLKAIIILILADRTWARAFYGYCNLPCPCSYAPQAAKWCYNAYPTNLCMPKMVQPVCPEHKPNKPSKASDDDEEDHSNQYLKNEGRRHEDRSMSYQKRKGMFTELFSLPGTIADTMISGMIQI